MYPPRMYSLSMRYYNDEWDFDIRIVTRRNSMRRSGIDINSHTTPTLDEIYEARQELSDLVRYKNYLLDLTGYKHNDFIVFGMKEYIDTLHLMLISLKTDKYPIQVIKDCIQVIEAIY